MLARLLLGIAAYPSGNRENRLLLVKWINPAFLTPRGLSGRSSPQYPRTFDPYALDANNRPTKWKLCFSAICALPRGTEPRVAESEHVVQYHPEAAERRVPVAHWRRKCVTASQCQILVLNSSSVAALGVTLFL
jgi:hypothetical protein